MTATKGAGPSRVLILVVVFVALAGTTIFLNLWLQPKPRPPVEAHDQVAAAVPRAPLGTTQSPTATSARAPEFHEPGERVPSGGPGPVETPQKTPPPVRERLEITEGTALWGLGYRVLTAAERQALSVPEHVTGVIVTEVHPQSAAAETHLRPDDVIAQANHKLITNEADLEHLIQDREQTTITIFRGGKPFNLVLHRPLGNAHPE